MNEWTKKVILTHFQKKSRRKKVLIENSSVEFSENSKILTIFIIINWLNGFFVIVCNDVHLQCF